MKQAAPELPPGPQRTLLLTLVFSPDGVSTAHLLSTLVRRLVGLGQQLSVVTTTPHYNRDETLLQQQPLRSYRGSWVLRSQAGAVPVYHVRVRPKGERLLPRLLGYLAFHALGLWVALSRKLRFDVILAPSPPLSIGLMAAVLARLRGVRFVYNVQEIYPDIAVSLGILKNPWLIRLLQLMERFIYRRADAVVVISERFRRRLAARGVPERKLRVIPNFVDTEVIAPRERRNDFSRLHGLDHRFVVLYAGNLGLTQDFETLFKAAEVLRDDPELLFLLVGDGACRRSLEERIRGQTVPNVRLLPYQPSAVVPDLYAACDVGLVPMLAGTALDTFPSKIYTILSAGRPVVVASDPDSELASVVEEARCGRIVPPGRVEPLVQALRELKNSPSERARLGVLGREFVVRRHSPETVALAYDGLLRELARRAKP